MSISLKLYYSQGIADEWEMGMNGDQFLPIHPQADEWG